MRSRTAMLVAMAITNSAIAANPTITTEYGGRSYEIYIVDPIGASPNEIGLDSCEYAAVQSALADSTTAIQLFDQVEDGDAALPNGKAHYLNDDDVVVLCAFEVTPDSKRPVSLSAAGITNGEVRYGSTGIQRIGNAQAADYLTKKINRDAAGSSTKIDIRILMRETQYLPRMGAIQLRFYLAGDTPETLAQEAADRDALKADQNVAEVYFRYKEPVYATAGFDAANSYAILSSGLAVPLPLLAYGGVNITVEGRNSPYRKQFQYIGLHGVLAVGADFSGTELTQILNLTVGARVTWNHYVGIGGGATYTFSEQQLAANVFLTISPTMVDFLRGRKKK